MNGYVQFTYKILTLYNGWVPKYLIKDHVLRTRTSKHHCAVMECEGNDHIIKILTEIGKSNNRFTICWAIEL